MNAVPLDQLDATIAESIRQVQNARYKAAAAGITTDISKPVAFQFNVSLPGGINAIQRNDISEQFGDQVALTENGEQIVTEESSGRQDASTTREVGAMNDSEVSNEAGSQNQTQTFGRQTATDITYEA